MNIEETDSTTNADHSSVPESRMTRRRALSFLVGGALFASVIFYFGFPSSPQVSAASNVDSSTSTSESSTTTEESSTTTTAKGGGW